MQYDYRYCRLTDQAGTGGLAEYVQSSSLGIDPAAEPAQRLPTGRLYNFLSLVYFLATRIQGLAFLTNLRACDVCAWGVCI
jgi:hypothetical protein